MARKGVCAGRPESKDTKSEWDDAVPGVPKVIGGPYWDVERRMPGMTTWLVVGAASEDGEGGGGGRVGWLDARVSETHTRL